MQEILSTTYRCEICGTIYFNKKDALVCEKFGKFLNTIKDKPLPQECWYKLKYVNSDDEVSYKLVFVIRAISSIQYKTCMKRSILLYSGESNNYFNISAASVRWEIIETYSIEEAYNKYKVLPLLMEKIENKENIEIIKQLHHKAIEEKLKKINQSTIDDVYNNFDLRHALLDEEYGSIRRNVKE